MDSGTSGCWARRSAIPKGLVPKELKENKTANTLVGKITANNMVTLRDICLPEFDKIHALMNNALFSLTVQIANMTLFLVQTFYPKQVSN